MREEPIFLLMVYSIWGFTRGFGGAVVTGLPLFERSTLSVGAIVLFENTIFVAKRAIRLVEGGLGLDNIVPVLLWFVVGWWRENQNYCEYNFAGLRQLVARFCLCAREILRCLWIWRGTEGMCGRFVCTIICRNKII